MHTNGFQLECTTLIELHLVRLTFQVDLMACSKILCVVLCGSVQKVCVCMCVCVYVCVYVCVCMCV